MLKKVVVIGAGQMGIGIVQYLLSKKLNVKLIGNNESKLNSAKSKVITNLEKMCLKGKVTEREINKFKNNFTASTNLNDSKNADLIIEAIPENLKQKLELIEALNGLVSESTILASNTSSFSITKLASKYKYQDRLIGLHFFNPVMRMPLVEVVKGLETSSTVLQEVNVFLQEIEKKGIVINDQPGFVVNRILIPMINEAIFVLQEGIASVADIDAAMKLGTNHPMGPLELADYIGLDTCLSIMETLHDSFGEDKYRPAVLLKQYVAANKLGLKNKNGFYNYS